MYSQIIVVGNTGKDAEIQYTPTGVAVCKFSIAESRYQGKDKDAKTVWYNCVVWREKTEIASQYIRKGKRLMVIGQIDVNAYINKQGQASASLELTVSEFKLLEKAEESQEYTRREEENEIPF